MGRITARKCHFFGLTNLPYPEFATFQSKGALFIGSVGEQPYRLVDPAFDRLPVPESPRTAYYLKPREGIREIILLREYSQDPRYPFFLGLPSNIYPEMVS